MAEKFTKFILDLANNPEALDRFKANPDQVTAAAGLSATERSVLHSRDAGLVRDAIVSDLARTGSTGADDAAGVTVVIWTHTRVKETDIAGLDVNRLANLTRRFR